MNEVEKSGGTVEAVGGAGRDSAVVTIDCRRCVFRDRDCANCVVSVVVDAEGPMHWSSEELRAISLLAEGGMVPSLRHAAA
ncbi:hypothetical protein SAXI111661_04645 [Saccharomonospora xinjiangensis]|uniref:hypothetical protein n=1 Tax=Saccharomonospora xinjiangensis TaxID=75294 RepID=UPI0010700861|nr:hypothetical protein [Saccharomonospora xinjiangensis]QBQ59544.1 hypothetical protein EYD13_05870 [Saccharomonospora xinjiangensis]